MSAESPSLARSEVVARVRRFAALRAAQRALTPSVRSPESLPTAGPLRAIRDQLRALLEAVESPSGGATAFGEADLPGIDDALDGYARQLRMVADGVSMPQFRASLPEAAQAQRGEVLALLDLLIEDDEPLDARLRLVDYLVTLLEARAPSPLRGGAEHVPRLGLLAPLRNTSHRRGSQ